MSETTKYTLYGTLFGLCFPLGSIVFLYVMGQLSDAHGLIGLIMQAHRSGSLLYVIDTAPFFLGLFARFAGIRQDRIQAFSASLKQQVAEKTASLSRALAEAEKANEMITHMADHDALTGLLNRRRFQKEVERWTRHALRYKHPVSLIFIDLDRFKMVNDTHGHTVGDQYLSAVGRLLTEVLRSTDIVARLGGDEFAILLSASGKEAAIDVADKLLKRCDELAMQREQHEVMPSLSMGIAVFPEHGPTYNELMALSDAAMYEAKAAGGNCWKLYSASGEERRRVEEHGRWEGRIRWALKHDQFVLFYQPVMALNTGATAGYEVLLRMEDPTGTRIGPGLFLESAERFALAMLVDRMVIGKAAHRITSLCVSDPWVSLNLSRQSLQDPALGDEIERIFMESQIGPGRMRFEITETMAIEHIGATRLLADRLTASGSALILDDFNLGVASMRCLRDISVSLVKIDGHLIRDLNRNEGNQKLVKNLVSIAHDHHISVVAKFVEDPDLMGLLGHLGVDYVQGFAVGRPMESLEQACAMEQVEV